MGCEVSQQLQPGVLQQLQPGVLQQLQWEVVMRLQVNFNRCFQGYCRHLGQGAVAAGG